MKMKKYFKQIFLLLIFLSICFTSLEVYRLETSKRILKADITELSDIKYGLFNVDIWKKKIASIISKKIEELEITEENKKENKIKIIKLLKRVINDFERNYKEKNRKESWFGISYKNIGANAFSIFEGIKENIPNIADEVVNFLEKKENRDQIKSYIISKLDNYTNETFQKIDYSEYNRILDKHRTKSINECNFIIENEIEELEFEINIGHYLILFVLFLCLLTILMFKQKSKLEIILYSLIALNLLTLGLLLPMIDIDARIRLMEFKLLGENINFKNQVLYFKSKSILEMAKLMLFEKKVKIFFVGILVLTFSVLFPVFKIISTISFLFIEKLKTNYFIRFMVFKSGKWSMADVMVVAIFMSYIGFSGIISSQLSQLEKISNRISILTTNNSDIQSGFFYFTGFVILGICISQMVHNKFEKKSQQRTPVKVNLG